MISFLSLFFAWGAFGAVSALERPDADAVEILVVASTTSTENSGLLDHLLPGFEKKTGIDVRVVAVGTGQAIRLAERGDADVLLVHHRPSEDAFVAAGYGVKRHEVMFNDFVLVGPRTDPVGVAGGGDVVAALIKIAADRAPFVSRGDDSGTHKREKELWAAAALDPETALGSQYRATGSGMGATLRVAAELDAYLLIDRGTWLSSGLRGDLAVLVEGDPPLHNPYGAILVNPKRHPHVRAANGRRFIEWLESDEGRARIASFRIAGKPLFHPSPKPSPNPAPKKLKAGSR